MNRHPPLPPPWRATLCLGAVLLSACGGATGQGNAPKLLVLGASGSTPSQTSGLVSLRVFECIPQRLSATLYFQDGSAGDFSARVQWSSSNAGAVAVSNGDIAAPGGGYYAAGTLVPVGSGSAVITADYDGIRAQTAVSAGTPQGLTMKMQRGSNDVVPDGGSFELGIGTTQQLQLTARLDGVETDLGDYAGWSLLAPNPSVATISASGAISAVGAGSAPLTVVASLPVCGLGTAADPATQLSFTVHHIQGIAIAPEFSGNPQLVVGNSELMRVVATLDDGATQDLSGQSTLSSSNDSVASFSGYTLSAAAAGGSIIGASFSGGASTYTAPSLAVTTVAASLQAVSVCWTEPDAAFSACPAGQDAAGVGAGSLTPVQFHAVGTYDSGTVTQEITRQVSWSSSDSTVASVSSGGLTAGQALGLSAQHTVTITATDGDAQNVTTASQQLSVR